MNVTFDTLKFVEKLETAGVSHARTKATAEAFAEAADQQLATRADLLAMKHDLLRWVIGLSLARIGLIAGLFLKLSGSGSFSGEP